MTRKPSSLLIALLDKAGAMPFALKRETYKPRPAYLNPALYNLEPRHYIDYSAGWSVATGTPPSYYPYGTVRKMDEHDGAFADFSF